MSENVPSASDSDAALDERLAAIEARLGDLNDRAAHREAVIDRLHSEKEELRRGERRALLEPVVADLIRMHDSLTAAAARAGAEAQPAHAELLRTFAEDVETMLDRCGIDTMTAEPGADHDVSEHRAVGVLLTDVRERHNTVADVVGIGFRDRDSGRVRRPLLARFHRFEGAGAGDEPAAG
jgi:molecular chaperone GrpE (heat shock protein)